MYKILARLQNCTHYPRSDCTWYTIYRKQTFINIFWKQEKSFVSKVCSESCISVAECTSRCTQVMKTVNPWVINRCFCNTPYISRRDCSETDLLLWPQLQCKTVLQKKVCICKSTVHHTYSVVNIATWNSRWETRINEFELFHMEFLSVKMLLPLVSFENFQMKFTCTDFAHV